MRTGKNAAMQWMRAQSCPELLWLHANVCWAACTQVHPQGKKIKDLVKYAGEEMVESTDVRKCQAAMEDLMGVTTGWLLWTLYAHNTYFAKTDIFRITFSEFTYLPSLLSGVLCTRWAFNIILLNRYIRQHECHHLSQGFNESQIQHCHLTDFSIFCLIN